MGRIHSKGANMSIVMGLFIGLSLVVFVWGSQS